MSAYPQFQDACTRLACIPDGLYEVIVSPKPNEQHAKRGVYIMRGEHMQIGAMFSSLTNPASSWMGMMGEFVCGDGLVSVFWTTASLNQLPMVEDQS